VQYVAYSKGSLGSEAQVPLVKGVTVNGLDGRTDHSQHSPMRLARRDSRSCPVGIGPVGGCGTLASMRPSSGERVGTEWD
jgi:hypothetical protein